MKRQYIKKLDAELGVLGFGLMRLPMNKEGWFDNSVYELVDRSIELGVNYFDTGFYYQNGKSEQLIQESLVKRYPRDKFYIADKLPVWDCHSKNDMEYIFNIQLERMGVDYIDFYLLHALHKKRWDDIYNNGVLDFLEEKKKEGKIRRVGFSFHDSGENMKEVLESYSWDFAQIQLNYYDWTVLHTEDNYRLLEEKGIPCFTMESVGGGRLSRLPDDAYEVFKKVHEKWTPSSWALRFVAALPNVAVALSGMNTMEQLVENTETCSDYSVLSSEEQRAITRVVGIMQSKEAIQCTACRYCVAGCPQKIDIPQVFKAYNDYKIFGDISFFDISYNLLAGFPRAEDCIGCGACKRACPQNIDIPGGMNMVSAVAFEREMGIKEIDTDYVICFGCGDYGSRLVKYLKRSPVRQIVFTDNNSNLWDKKFNGYSVIRPEDIVEILKNNNAKIIISTIKYRNEIATQLKEYGIEEDRFLN